MNEKEYLLQLEQLLTGLPDVEKQEDLEYVKEYIEEAKSSGVSDYMATLPLAEEFARSLRSGLDEGISNPLDNSIQMPELPKSGGYESSLPKRDPYQSNNCSLYNQELYKQDQYNQIQRSSRPLIHSILIGLGLLILSPFVLVLLAMILVAVIMVFLTLFMAFLMILLFGMMIGVMILAFGISILPLVYKALLLASTDFLGSIFDFGLALLCLSAVILLFHLARIYFKKFIPASWNALKKGVFWMDSKIKERFYRIRKRFIN